MIEIPPEIQIKATIRPGSVYYFPEESFQSLEPHYFVVINSDPYAASVVVLVCASSQIGVSYKRRRRCPRETLVEISPRQYPDFTADSIIDCNYVLEKSIEQLVEKLSQGELQSKTEMDINMVERLRKGVIMSQLVEERIKDLLK